MLYITGVGIVTDDNISVKYKKQTWSYDGIKKLSRCLKDNQIIQASIKDFGRLDEVSKKTVAATALALFDSSGKSPNSNIGIIGSNETGSLISNFHYFKDYVDSGRKMGRGNLFVYTLPTASISAASIAFGFKGPVFFEMYTQSDFSRLAWNVKKTMSDLDCTGMIVVYGCNNCVTAFYVEELEKKSVDDDLIMLEEFEFAVC